MSPLNITQPLGIWSIMATIRWCPIAPKMDIYQSLSIPFSKEFKITSQFLRARQVQCLCRSRWMYWGSDKEEVVQVAELMGNIWECMECLKIGYEYPCKDCKASCFPLELMFFRGFFGIYLFQNFSFSDVKFPSWTKHVSSQKHGSIFTCQKHVSILMSYMFIQPARSKFMQQHRTCVTAGYPLAKARHWALLGLQRPKRRSPTAIGGKTRLLSDCFGDLVNREV